MAVGGSPGKIFFGYTTRDLVTRDITGCPLAAPAIQSVLVWLQSALNMSQISPYDVKRDTGELKFVLVKVSESSGEILVRFVLRSENAISQIRTLASLLQREVPAVRVVSVNLQPEHKAIIEGETEIVLTSEAHIKEAFGTTVLYFGPQTFTQINSAVAAKLYAKVSKEVSNLRPRMLFDLYCGVGGFGIQGAAYSGRVVGIEYSALAIEAAERGARENRVANIELFSGDVEAYLSTYTGMLPEIVVVNPPRRGLSSKIIQSVSEMRPRTIFYSSCNPETLRRDAEGLNSVYRIREVTPFDMFPLTEHVEVLAVFDAREPGSAL